MPLKLSIVSVGTRLPTWAEQGYAEFARRLSGEYRLELVEVKAEKRAGLPVEQLLESERVRIEAALPKGATLIALDERGRHWTTAELANQIARWRDAAIEPAFIIGGADGLAPGLKSRAAHAWSLSALTLPHALVRVILAEQLYRAVSILQKHPYHRA